MQPGTPFSVVPPLMLRSEQRAERLTRSQPTSGQLRCLVLTLATSRVHRRANHAVRCSFAVIPSGSERSHRGRVPAQCRGGALRRWFFRNTRQVSVAARDASAAPQTDSPVAASVGERRSDHPGVNSKSLSSPSMHQQSSSVFPSVARALSTSSQVSALSRQDVAYGCLTADG